MHELFEIVRRSIQKLSPTEKAEVRAALDRELSMVKR
jgi:hypothetical protein